MCPKDLRSSFVTFLKSEEHSDETLRAERRAGHAPLEPDAEQRVVRPRAARPCRASSDARGRRVRGALLKRGGRGHAGG
eukprot:7380610-Prymnesium_polylepis.2